MIEVKGKMVYLKIKDELLAKTPFSKKGIRNVMMSMISEFVDSENKDFFVYIKSNGNVFHFVKEECQLNEIVVSLKNIYQSDFYVNQGLITRNVTKTPMLH